MSDWLNKAENSDKRKLEAQKKARKAELADKSERLRKQNEAISQELQARKSNYDSHKKRIDSIFFDTQRRIQRINNLGNEHKKVSWIENIICDFAKKDVFLYTEPEFPVNFPQLFAKTKVSEDGKIENRTLKICPSEKLGYLDIFVDDGLIPNVKISKIKEKDTDNIGDWIGGKKHLMNILYLGGYNRPLRIFLFLFCLAVIIYIATSFKRFTGDGFILFAALVFLNFLFTTHPFLRNYKWLTGIFILALFSFGSYLYDFNSAYVSALELFGQVTLVYMFTIIPYFLFLKKEDDF